MYLRRLGQAKLGNIQRVSFIRRVFLSHGPNSKYGPSLWLNYPCHFVAQQQKGNASSVVGGAQSCAYPLARLFLPRAVGEYVKAVALLCVSLFSFRPLPSSIGLFFPRVSTPVILPSQLQHTLYSIPALEEGTKSDSTTARNGALPPAADYSILQCDSCTVHTYYTQLCPLGSAAPDFPPPIQYHSGGRGHSLDPTVDECTARGSQSVA
jgi:hypothetical protein